MATQKVPAKTGVRSTATKSNSKPVIKATIKAAIKPAAKTAPKAAAVAHKPTIRKAAVGAKTAKPPLLKNVSPALKPVTAATKPISKALPKVTKKVEPKPKKIKQVRDSFTMPETEYEVLGQVKKACLKAGFEIKKSDLLRIGVSLIKNLETAKLKTLLAGLTPLKVGRPKK